MKYEILPLRMWVLALRYPTSSSNLHIAVFSYIQLLHILTENLQCPKVNWLWEY